MTPAGLPLCQHLQLINSSPAATTRLSVSHSRDQCAEADTVCRLSAVCKSVATYSVVQQTSATNTDGS